MPIKDKQKLLQEPFESGDLEWRVQMCGVSGSRPWVAVVAYVTNRAIQKRLDDVFGFDGWQNQYAPSPCGKGFLCGISIRTDVGDWVTKWDGSENTEIEPLKGGLSGSMKRAAVQLGIGRYLYQIETKFAQCELADSKRDCKDNHSKTKDGQHINWRNPELPDWALPHVQSDEYIRKIENSETISDLQVAFAESWKHAKAFNREDLKDIFKNAYDKSMSRIDEVNKKNIEKELISAKKWLSSQIDSLSHIPDAISIDRVTASMKDHLIKISTGHYYDVNALIQELEDAAHNRKILIEEK